MHLIGWAKPSKSPLRLLLIVVFYLVVQAGPGCIKEIYAGEPSGVPDPTAPSGNKSGSPKAVETPSASGTAATAYCIGIGDVLSISNWKDDAMTRQVQVLSDGTISFPLLGVIRVDGLTLSDLHRQLTQRLSRYIPDATLSVQVLQASSQAVYVIGKANRPGRFDLFNNLNVLQVLALAGGLNPFAKSSSIRIFRETEKGSQILLFDYDEVAKGENLTQNIRLERGDVIVVP